MSGTGSTACVPARTGSGWGWRGKDTADAGVESLEVYTHVYDESAFLAEIERLRCNPLDAQNWDIGQFSRTRAGCCRCRPDDVCRAAV